MNSDIVTRKIQKYESRLRNATGDKRQIYMDKLQQYKTQTGGDTLANEVRNAIEVAAARAQASIPPEAKTAIEGLAKSLEEIKGEVARVAEAAKTIPEVKT